MYTLIRLLICTVCLGLSIQILLLRSITLQLYVKILHYLISFFCTYKAGQAAGLSEEQIKSAVSRIKDQAVKDRLKQYTEEALKYGVSVCLKDLNHMLYVPSTC